MSELILSRDEVRAVDRTAIDEFGIPGVVLMENAGRGCVEILLERGVHGPVVICCGKGNNGGDGFVIARHLANRNIEVQTWLMEEPEEYAGDAAVNLRILQRAGFAVHVIRDPTELEDALQRADWIVDALLGTGTQGAPRGLFIDVIRKINDAASLVLAVDLPSGLDCDSGEHLGECVCADVTATFVARKIGFLNESACSFLGDVRVVEIGIPDAVLTGLFDGKQ